MANTPCDPEAHGIEVRFTVIVTLNAQQAADYGEEFDLTWHDGSLVKSALADHIAQWSTNDIARGTTGDRANVRMAHVSYT